MTEAVPLKPCPFCGSPALYLAYGNNKHQVQCDSDDLKCPARPQTFTHRTKEAVIENWNTRVTEQTLKQQVKTLMEALQPFLYEGFNEELLQARVDPGTFSKIIKGRLALTATEETP